MKKIALCISGKFRNSIFCFPTLYGNFIKNKNTDVFIHTWDNLQNVFDLYNPKKILIENQDEIYDNLFPDINLSKININRTANIKNNFLMFYGIKKCIDMVNDEYDYIIRIRPDLYLQKTIPLNAILDDIEKNRYDIQIPDERQNHTGLNDQIAIGSYFSMKTYSDVYKNIKKIVDKTHYWHVETILKEHITMNNIKINQIPYEYGIVRKVDVTFTRPTQITYLPNGI